MKDFAAFASFIMKEHLQKYADIANDKVCRVSTNINQESEDFNSILIGTLCFALSLAMLEDYHNWITSDFKEMLLQSA